MPRQSWSESVHAETADGTAVANTTTETIIISDLTVPGNQLKNGKTYRLTAMGRISCTGTPTITFFLRWGGVVGTILAQSGAITLGSGLTNACYKVELLIQNRVNGASGSLFVMGSVTIFEDAVPAMGTVTNYGCESPMTSAGVSVPAAVTVNLTADTALSLSADWSAASASNTLTNHLYVVEDLN